MHRVNSKLIDESAKIILWAPNFFLEITESLDYSAVSCGSSVGKCFCFSFNKESKVARDAKEMRNTQDTRTGFVSCKSGRF